MHDPYLSTACLHETLADDPDEATRLHSYCAGTTRWDGGNKSPARCKFCDARCVCPRHLTHG